MRYTWFISGCQACGLVFTNPPPSQQEIDSYYVGDGEWAAEKLRPKNWAESQTRPLKPSQLSIVNTIDQAVPKTGTRRVLDFGCGRGHVLRGLKERGWETSGIDPMTAHLLQSYGHTMLETMPDEPMFDAAVMNHVLEHCVDPLEVLRGASRCLKPSGYIYVGTPTLDRLQEHGKDTYCINHKFHLSAFTQQSMTNLLALAGFRIVGVCPTGLSQRLALLAQRDDTARTLMAPLQDAQRELQAHRADKMPLGNLLPIRIHAFLGNITMLARQTARRLLRPVLSRMRYASALR